MESYKITNELNYFIDHPHELNNYVEDLVNVLCKHNTQNQKKRSELVQNMKQLLLPCAMTHRIYEL